MAADIRIRIGLEGTQSVTSGIGVVTGKLSDLDSRTLKVGDAFKNLAVSMVAGLSVAGLASFVKQGIDAADMANQVAQKTGLATKEIAGIQLAFKQGGVESGAMTAALAKMQKQMVDGNEAFDAMGVKTRNADGSMRSVKTVLYETADAFANMERGAARTALAQEVFGKSGADLLPVLEGGSQGLRDMAEMAEKLGLEIDDNTAKAADQFNDQVELLGLGVTGVATRIAANLLPTLANLSQGFLESMTEGDRLRKLSDMLSAALKGLYTGGVLVAEAFNTVGKTIGAAGAQIMAVLAGDFKGAMAIGKEYAADMKKGWAGTAQTIAKAWDDSGTATMQTMAQVVKAGKEVTLQTNAQKTAAKEAAAEAKKAAKEREDAIKSMLKAEAEQEKLRKDWYAAEAKRELDRIAQYERRQQAVDASIEQADAMVAAIDAETAALGMSNTEREISNKLLELEEKGLQKGKFEYEVYAQKIREAVVSREAVRTSIEHTQKVADEWKKMTDQIGQGLTDSLFRAFESGKSFFKTLWDGIVNTFKTTVLRLAVNAVMNPVNAGIGSLLGAGSSAAQGSSLLGGLGGLGDMAGMLGGIGGALGSFGSAAGFGASALFGGTGMTALGGAGSMIGAGSLAGGLGMAAGVLGPVAGIGAGLYALYKAIGNESTPHSGGGAVSDASGTQSGKYSLVQSSMKADLNTSTQQYLAATTGTVAQMLNTLSKTGGGANVRVASAYADDKSKDPAWAELRIAAGDKKLVDWRDATGKKRLFDDGQAGLAQYQAAVAEASVKAAAELGLPDWAQKIITDLGSNASLEQLGAAVEKIAAMKADMESTSNTQVEQSAQQMDLMEASSTQIERISESVVSIGDRIVAAMDSLRQSVEAGLAATAAASQETTLQLRRWDDGGAIVTTPAA